MDSFHQQFHSLLSQAGSDGVGGLCLIGCGYNAYPAGSQYAEYPQMDDKQEDRQKRKYRYIIHAEQNALTFRYDHWQKTNGQIKKQISLWFLSLAGPEILELGSPHCCLLPSVHVTSVFPWSEERASHTFTPLTRTRTKTRETFPTWGSAVWRESRTSL